MFDLCALETLNISPQLSFGGIWESIKSSNTIIRMLSQSWEELERLCKISQEDEVSDRGPMPPLLCGDSYH